jgi:hypothetical protein
MLNGRENLLQLFRHEKEELTKYKIECLRKIKEFYAPDIVIYHLIMEADKKFENIITRSQATYSLGSIDLSLTVMFLKLCGEAEGLVCMDEFSIAPSIGAAYYFNFFRRP